MLRGFPSTVRDRIGYALYEAQRGENAHHVKPLKGFHGAGVWRSWKIMMDRRIGQCIQFVLPIRSLCFTPFKRNQKKSIATPTHDLDLIQARLKMAEEDFEKEN